MFFSQLSQAMVEGIDLSLVIRKQADRLTVSVLPKSESLKDGTRNNIAPLIVSGYPAELDAGFIASAFRPLQRVEGLITNIVQFERQAEKAASESKQVKGRTGNKSGNETKEEAEKRERYEKALKRADELIAARSFDDAMTALQQARLYAPQQQIKSIDEKIAAVKTELNQGPCSMRLRRSDNGNRRLRFRRNKQSIRNRQYRNRCSDCTMFPIFRKQKLPYRSNLRNNKSQHRFTATVMRISNPDTRRQCRRKNRAICRHTIIPNIRRRIVPKNMRNTQISRKV